VREWLFVFVDFISRWQSQHFGFTWVRFAQGDGSVDSEDGDTEEWLAVGGPQVEY